MRPSTSEMGQNLHANKEGFAKLVIIKMVKELNNKASLNLNNTVRMCCYVYGP